MSERESEPVLFMMAFVLEVCIQFIISFRTVIFSSFFLSSLLQFYCNFHFDFSGSFSMSSGKENTMNRRKITILSESHVTSVCLLLLMFFFYFRIMIIYSWYSKHSAESVTETRNGQWPQSRCTKNCNLENSLNSISAAAIVFVILRDFDSVVGFYAMRERYSKEKPIKKERIRDLWPIIRICHSWNHFFRSVNV